MKILASPISLFSIGVMQALYPYLIWMLGVEPARYISKITYFPAYLYISGLIFFVAGCLFVGPQKTWVTPVILDLISARKLEKLVLAILCALAVQLFALVKLYGALPILLYVQGGFTAADLHTLQEDSSFGQIGLYVVTLMVGNMVISIYLVKKWVDGSRLTFKDAGMVLFFIAATIVDGKRQAFMMFFSTITFSFILLACRPAGAFLLTLVRRCGNYQSFFLVAGILVVLVNSAFLLFNERSGRDHSSMAEHFFNYHEYALLNMERQMLEDGFGPGYSDPRIILSSLVPAKMMESEHGSRVLKVPPKKLEPSSPSGFYERLQWYGGPEYVLLGAFLAGVFSQVLFVMAGQSLFGFMAYSHICWFLVMSCLYNHFLSHIFFWTPLAAIFCVSRYISPPARLMIAFPTR